ncbi:hypothetical protein [Sporosarcina limicola]|uniref:Uncharacterized protein n=1 Tax=Sporosarcina limicola TaxID=34101 RepID=A0A927MPV9_9BACL|nr:hypothetical protein [Sporosarcina limicola]MBE1557092.1 hypothetical protein [Sporosarcina limicola]
MIKRNKHIKNIKIYNKKHISFKELKRTPFFSYFDKQSEYRLPLFEALINIVRDFNPYDQTAFVEFEELTESHFEFAEINSSKDIPVDIKYEIIKQLYCIYQKREFLEFRGNFVEYTMVYLEKSNESKIYHEPLFYHKRKKLFKREFPGCNCLIDIVKLHNTTKSISLIECKADLDVRIKRMNNKGDKFKNKLSLMNALENVLNEYSNFNQEKISVSKSLASIKAPIRRLPGEYKNFVYINLFDQFRLKKKNVS